jgi:hypothetical protein
MTDYRHGNTSEYHAPELYSILLKIWIEVMDFPPKKPFSTDSYLPPTIKDEILSVLGRVNPSLYSELQAKKSGR